MGEPVRGTPIPPSTERGYEHSDVAIRPLAIFIAGLAITLLIVTGLMAALFWMFESGAERSDPAPLPLAKESPTTPGPLLQVSPREDLSELREREQRMLSTPAWVDRDRGVARIPIDSAIKLTAERGLPDWSAVESSPPQSEQGTDGDRSPQTPEAGATEGTGQTTPVEGGREP